jgi:hypothetical protein
MPLKLFRPKIAPANPDTAVAPTEPGTSPKKGGATMTTATLRDQLIVTYAVPPERVASLIPAGLTLDRLPSAEGDITAFVQVMCGLYQAARWSPLPEFVGDAFYQILYRVLVRRTVVGNQEQAKPERRPAVWILHTFASTTERHIARRLVDREVDFARIRLFVDGDPARNLYSSYRLRAETDNGPTYLSASFENVPQTVPAPFGSLADMTAFLTERNEQFFRLSVPGSAVGLIPLRHDPVTALSGTLTEARVAPFINARILSVEEAKAPQSVLLVPALTVHAFPPRPIKLLSDQN